MPKNGAGGVSSFVQCSACANSIESLIRTVNGFRIIETPPPTGLERAQKIDDFLLFVSLQLIKVIDHLTCLAARALVGSDGLHQVAGPPVMEEENALSDAPQGSGSELVGAGGALRDAVCKAFAHVVDKKVRVKIDRLIGKRSAGAG